MKKTFVISLFVMLVGLFGCHAQTPAFKSVDVPTFAKAIADTSVVILDVRTPKEFADGHIEGAVNIDFLNSSFATIAPSQLPKDKTIAIYCRSGNRSKKAASFLAAKGYTLIELNKGYFDWVSQHQTPSTQK